MCKAIVLGNPKCHAVWDCAPNRRGGAVLNKLDVLNQVGSITSAR